MRADASALARLLDRLKGRLRIAVVYAGDRHQPGTVVQSTYSPRPWKSYRQVAEEIRETLIALGFPQTQLFAEGLDLPARLHQAGIHLVWLNSGGVQGRNSICHAAACLESLGIPYVGHSPGLAALLDDKVHFKAVLRGLGLPTPDAWVWHPGMPTRFVDSPAFRACFAQPPTHYVVKPCCGRASHHVHRVVRADVEPTVQDVYRQTYDTVLVEAFLPGREFCVAGSGPVIVRAGQLAVETEPLSFCLLERLLEADEAIFRSIDQRGLDTSRVRLLDPSQEPARVAELTRLCQALFNALDLNSLVRLDLREDADHRLQILEANPKPDLKRPSSDHTSLLAMGLPAGMDYTDLILSQLAGFLHRALTCCPPSAALLAPLLAEPNPWKEKYAHLYNRRAALTA